MKHTVIAFTCSLALLSAVAGNERSNSPKMTTTNTDEVSVLDAVRQLNNAFAANDPEKYFSYVDPEITVMTPSNPYRVEAITGDRAEFEHGLKTRSIARQLFSRDAGESAIAW